mmetsp:Transcript_20941/g.45666  ORF Transcript_20941/g.45666 Transcript_20941/m.45666 type:complete len:240 (-) Transcript_20941:114-833(-)
MSCNTCCFFSSNALSCSIMLRSCSRGVYMSMCAHVTAAATASLRRQPRQFPPRPTCTGSISSCLQRRCITKHAMLSAEQLLGLTDKPRYTARDLRMAYFDAAKRCHPDSSHEEKAKGMAPTDAARRFLIVTEAYELLRTTGADGGGDAAWPEAEASFVTKTEEEEFREACKEWLGLPAETVEESKKCPLFREWLQGGTDAACHWSNFLFLHGGLVPKLRPPSALIGEGKVTGPRRRKRR